MALPLFFNMPHLHRTMIIPPGLATLLIPSLALAAGGTCYGPSDCLSGEACILMEQNQAGVCMEVQVEDPDDGFEEMPDVLELELEPDDVLPPPEVYEYVEEEGADGTEGTEDTEGMGADEEVDLDIGIPVIEHEDAGSGDSPVDEEDQEEEEAQVNIIPDLPIDEPIILEFEDGFVPEGPHEIPEEDVETRHDLRRFAELLLFSDDKMTQIRIEQDGITITYQGRSRLFGFIPKAFTVTVTVTSDGQVEIEKPWWLIIASDNVNSFLAELQSSNLILELKNVDLASSPSKQQEVINRITELLRKYF